MLDARSNRPDVRNPMLRMPEISEGWARLTAESRMELVGILKIISKAAHAHGSHHWENRKFQSAAYWKAKAVDARHLAMAGRLREKTAASSTGLAEARRFDDWFANECLEKRLFARDVHVARIAWTAASLHPAKVVLGEVANAAQPRAGS